MVQFSYKLDTVEELEERGQGRQNEDDLLLLDDLH